MIEWIVDVVAVELLGNDNDRCLHKWRIKVLLVVLMKIALVALLLFLFSCRFFFWLRRE